MGVTTQVRKELSKLRRLHRALMGLINKKALTRFVLTSEATNNFDASFKISWSQGVEDLAILGTIPKYNNPTYIDIGAHHPSRFSVTRQLYSRGWRGINIEANQDLIKLFEGTRPEDVNICAAVGEENEYIFYVLSEPGMSTINEKWRDYAIQSGLKVEKEVKVSGMSLRSVFDKHYKEHGPTLICIDIEGADDNALKSLRMETLESYRFPKWILLETFPPVKDALFTDSVKRAIQFGYEPFLVLPMSTLLKSPFPD